MTFHSSLACIGQKLSSTSRLLEETKIPNGKQAVYPHDRDRIRLKGTPPLIS